MYEGAIHGYYYRLCAACAYRLCRLYEQGASETPKTVFLGGEFDSESLQ